MRKLIYVCFFALLAAAAHSCMEYGPREGEDFEPVAGRGVFVVAEGNFTYGNASLSFYDPAAKCAENDVFGRANGIKLGDVAQSMAVHGDKGYIVVNNSGVIFIIDIDTYKVTGTMTGFTSPRYIHFVSDTKAYVTDLYAARIAVVDPQTCAITGYVDTRGHKSTEQMVQWGRYVFVNCWSLDNTILVIDSERDEVVDEIEVGIQPTSLALDKFGKIWAITDGGFEGSPYGYEAPSLCRIDAATWKVEERFAFTLGDHPSELCLNGARDMLYFINKSVWRMDVTEERVPLRPFLEYRETIYYGLAVDPVTSEVYVADAIDYQQPGAVYRYSAEGELLDSFRVGITPGAFCFK